MRIIAEINVKFDGQEPKTRGIGKVEIAEAIASAVSECSKIENVASVRTIGVNVQSMCKCGGYDGVEFSSDGHATDCPEAQE